MRLFSLLYQGAWVIARPFLSRHRRLAEGWTERLVPDDWAPRFDGKTVWIQAASGGEAFLLAHIVAELQKLWSEAGRGKLRILATTCTRQGMDVFEKKLAGPKASGLEVLFRYFPLDEPRLMRRAMDQAAPAQIVLLETELWPGLLMAAWERNIPVQVLNGRITPKSMAGYGKFPPAFWKNLSPRKILAISQADAGRYAELFGNDVVGQMPNIKFDLISTGKEEDLRAPAPDGGKVALFASVRRQEADLVAEAVRALIDKAPGCRVVLAPRHLHHVGMWRRAISRMGMRIVLRSEIAEPGLPPQAVLASIKPGSGGPVLIWDRFGDLKTLYSLADCAYVGGSLVSLGGQNFLEALSEGIEPCIGPYYSNFAWVGGEILEMARQVSGPLELASALERILAAPKPRQDVRKRFEKSVESRRGGTKIAVAAILELLD